MRQGWARSIMYDAGTESESFEWYRVRGAPKSECRLTQQRIDILSLPHPPVATAAAPRAPAPMPAAPLAPRRGSGGRKGAPLWSFRLALPGSGVGGTLSACGT